MPPLLLPKEPTLWNYKIVLDYKLLPNQALNTAVLLAVSPLASLLVTTSAAYAFAIFRFKGKQVIFWAFLSATMITRYALLIPLFVVMRRLNITGLWAVGAVYIFDPVGIYLFKNYIETIPFSFVESARIDGVGEWGSMFRIILPLCGPAMAVVMIGRGFMVLQDYIWQFLVLQRNTNMTLLVALNRRIMDLRSESINLENYGAHAAVGVLLLIPLVLLFAVGQKYIIKGVTMGGVRE